MNGFEQCVSPIRIRARLNKKPRLSGVSGIGIGTLQGLRRDDGVLLLQRGNTELPIRKASTSRAHCRPSLIAQTIKD